MDGNPNSHPGVYLIKIIEHKQQTITQFSSEHGLNEAFIREFINGDVNVTPLLAETLEQVTHISADSWINLRKITKESMPL